MFEDPATSITWSIDFGWFRDEEVGMRNGKNNRGEGREIEKKKKRIMERKMKRRTNLDKKGKIGKKKTIE